MAFNIKQGFGGLVNFRPPCEDSEERQFNFKSYEKTQIPSSDKHIKHNVLTEHNRLMAVEVYDVLFIHFFLFIYFPQNCHVLTVAEDC